MALLSTTTRNNYLKAIGFKSVLDFQKKAFSNKKEHDNKYGTKTDNALRTYYNVYKYTKNFKPEEFKCKCGKCCGYPTYMKPEALKGIQAFRTKYGKSITVTSGMRCSGKNGSLKGSSSNSKHLTGYAIDFYQKGVTDTLANRKNAINYFKTLSGHNYGYGNGWCSSGYKVSAPNMGNALHIDFNHVASKTATISKAEKLARAGESISWAYGTPEKKWSYKTGSPTPLCKTWMKKRGYTSKVNMSDCGYFINTVIYKALGKKVKVLAGTKDPFPSVSGFTIVHRGAVTSKNLKRGDIIRYKSTSGQHVCMYLGNGLIDEAGRKIRNGVIRKSAKYNSSYVKKSTVQVLRVKE